MALRANAATTAVAMPASQPGQPSRPQQPDAGAAALVIITCPEPVPKNQSMHFWPCAKLLLANKVWLLLREEKRTAKSIDVTH